MAYFPSFRPFYDPDKEQEVYREQDGSLKVRSRTPAASGVELSGVSRSNTGIDSKVESSWAYHVQPNQGELFYINVNGKTRRSNSLPQHKLSATGFSKSEDGHAAHFRRDGMRHSDSAVSPSCMSHRSSGEEDDEKNQLRTEIRQKSEQIHQVLKKKQDDLQNGKIPYSEKFHSGQKSTQSRAKLSLVHQNNSRLLLSQQEENFSTCLKVRDSTEQIVSDSYSESLNNGDSNHFYQKGRQLKEVIIMPDFSKKHDVINTKMSGAELFEDLMGITLCHYNQRPPSGSKVNGEISGHYSNKDQKLVVQGVIVGSPADKTGKIHRGDMLLYLNGQEVTWSNLKSLLQSNNREVKLTLQVPKIIGPTSCSNGNGINRLSAYYNMCLLVTGEDIFQVQQKLLCHSCVAMYLTLTSSDETSEHDDIIYSFPPQEEKLTAIRGLFLTLSSSLIDILQSGAKSSSLDVDHHPVNVVYHQHGRDVLILATPADRVPMAKLQQMLDDVARMLCTVYGSLDRSFSGVDSRQHDQLFAMLFYQLLGLSGPDSVTLILEEAASAPSCSLPLSAIPVLQLSEENKLICDEILSEFEAVDFDDFLEDEALYNRRSYSVLGCSLFYKNYLVCTHLSDSDHLDVQCFLKCQNLLSLAARQTIDELVIWQEVYLTRKDCAVAKGIIPGYQEPTARWFMLIVGMKHFLLASLLEAGGCSQTVKGRPRPHPLYIDQARATLMQLDTEEVHMSTCCEERLNRESDSQLIRTDKYVSRGRSGKEDSGIAVRSKPPSPVRAGNDSAFKFKSSPRSDRRPASEADAASSEGVMRRQGSKLSYGSNDSGGSGSSAGAPKSKSSRFSSLLDMSSIGRSMSALHIDTIGGQSSLGKLTRGKENVLFHFIHYDNLQGILLTPSDVNTASSSDSVQSELVTNFYRCVLNIHTIFKSQDLHQNLGYAPSPIRCLNLATKSMKEQGVLFHCPAQSPVSGDRRQVPKLVYWVVGRHFTTELNQTEAVDQTNTFSQELYVCFHESVHQSLVEVAFSLGFGS